ncbi:MAG: integrase catalytic region [Microgenomates bacterium 39_7]|nr:MAG: integrase catalytic region [Microgenomates bacterium 39_7]
MFSANSQYDWLMKTLSNSFKFDQSDPAKFRLHVLEHYYKYGWKPTTEAFKVGKSTLYDWKNRYEASNKALLSLIPKKTRPKRVRQMTTDWRLIQFIREFRQQHGNIGREKIKIFLDEYALELGINSISHRTITKIIKRKNLFFDQPVKSKRKNKFARDRTRKSPKVKAPGYIEMDSVVIYINNIRHNFMCCIDIYTKFAYTRKVKTLSSLQAKLTFQEFEKRSPNNVHTVQTDNGSEFFKTFHKYLEESNIKHQFIYPKSPKINGVVERFNRTIQEEFINRSDEIYYDEKAFEIKLHNYLAWYNNKRPHTSLGYLSPMQFIQTNFPKSMCL